MLLDSNLLVIFADKHVLRWRNWRLKCESVQDRVLMLYTECRTVGVTNFSTLTSLTMTKMQA